VTPIKGRPGLHDTLRLLAIWFDYYNNAEIYDVLYEGIRHTPTEIWLKVIRPQPIARIDTNKQHVARLIHTLLIEFGRLHPKAFVYRPILVSKCTNMNLTNAAPKNVSIKNSSNPINSSNSFHRLF
jgi:hypothetical protein